MLWHCELAKDLGHNISVIQQGVWRRYPLQMNRAILMQYFLSRSSYRFMSHDTSKAKLGDIDDQSEA
jgi:hypothetical protein